MIVSQAYPFPYGFVLDTTSEDGDNVDCFVITDRPLKTGTIVRCEPVGLSEQIKDGEADHNLLALLPDETLESEQAVLNTLREFILHVFDHIPGKKIAVGRLHGKDLAKTHIRACSDRH